MANASLAIEVKELTKTFGKLTAVDRVSFEVKRGELFGFLGPNGAGKTTTARMLTGAINPDGGNATVMGYRAGSLRAKQVSGVVPEMSNAYNDLTAMQNMTLMAELYGVPVKEASERSARLLEGLGLSERKDSQVQTYSGGMRKRLILAMALLPDPEIVFLDEPTSALDVQSTRFIRMMLRNLRKDGKTLFLTTHNMDEAAELCDRIAIINRGKLVALDTPDHLSIVAGKVYLVDVTFDKPVPRETLLKLRGVKRVETAEAIEAADRMRVAAALAAARPMMPGARQAMPGGAGMQVMANDNKPVASENKVRIQTEDTALVVESLVEFTHSSSNRITNIVIRPPSLEDAFVALTQKEPNNG